VNVDDFNWRVAVNLCCGEIKLKRLADKLVEYLPLVGSRNLLIDSICSYIFFRSCKKDIG